jgi:hypothetical protein
MAGKIIADIIEAPAGRISLNVANVTVASINASGLYTSTGNLIISQANQIGTAAIVDGAVTNAKLTLAANASNIKTALNATGDAPIYAARAWVNFNGTGTVAIRGSGNVSSITDDGNGLYTVNFTTAMPDANYAFTSGVQSDDISYLWVIESPRFGTYSTTALQIQTATQSGSTTLFRRDTAVLNVTIFR